MRLVLFLFPCIGSYLLVFFGKDLFFTFLIFNLVIRSHFHKINKVKVNKVNKDVF